MFTISNIVKRSVNYFLVVLLARNSTPIEFGMYSTSLNILSLLLILSNFGFSEYILVNSETIQKLNKNTSKFILYSILIAGFITFLGSIFFTHYYFLFIIIGLKIYIEGPFIQIILSNYQVKNEIHKISSINLITSLLTIIALIISYSFSFNLHAILLASTIVNFIFIIINYYYIKPQYNSNFIRSKTIKKTFKELKYYGISMITIPFYMLTPGFVGALMLSKSDLSIFQIAFSISSLIIVILSSYIQSSLPKFLKQSNNIKEFKKLLTKTGLIIFSFNVLILTFFYLFGERVLMLIYNDEFYVQSYFFLLLLIIANTLQALAGTLGIFFTINKLQKERFSIQMEFVVLSWLLSFSLTYYLSLTGLVYSFVILFSYVLIRYYMFFRKKIKLIEDQ